MKSYLSIFALVSLLTISCIDSFTIAPLSSSREIITQQHQLPHQTKLCAQKQTRSSLLNPPKTATTANNGKSTKNNDPQQTSSEEIYGAKFFGGSAIKEELFDAELEERADKMMKLYPNQSTSSIDVDVNADAVDAVDPNVYLRFMDTNAFPDDDARCIAQSLQSAVNEALYESTSTMNNDPISGKERTTTTTNNKSIYSSTSLQWNTPFSKDSKSRTPLDELEHTLNFYKRIDVAIIAAKTLSSSPSEEKKMEIRWEISLVWPNVFESSVLISGSSIITVNSSTSTITSQTDTLDNGGKDGRDIIQAISSQLQPRFWDLYHVGMTPSAQLMPRIPSTSSNSKKGIFSSYDVFEIPPRLVYQPTVMDTGGRDLREAQSLPNHAFQSIIKTTGPSGQRYVTTSPVEVSIRRKQKVVEQSNVHSQQGEKEEPSTVTKSTISWNIGVPPEYISYHYELSKAVSEEDKEEGNDPTNDFVYQQRRLVATIKYGGDAQDVEVTNIRKKLYEEVTKDGFKPKLDENGRPQFFFLQNDTKACFTVDGGLGMGVYEWRFEAANSNEVGIELEL